MNIWEHLMLRVSVVASADVFNSKEWTDVLAWMIEYAAASCMSTLYFNVEPGEVIMTKAERCELPAVTPQALPDAYIYVDVSAPMNESWQVEGILEGCLRHLKERIASACPAAWDGRAQHLV